MIIKKRVKNIEFVRRCLSFWDIICWCISADLILSMLEAMYLPNTCKTTFFSVAIFLYYRVNHISHRQYIQTVQAFIYHRLLKCTRAILANAQFSGYSNKEEGSVCVIYLYHVGSFQVHISTETGTCWNSRCTLQWISHQLMMIEQCFNFLDACESVCNIRLCLHWKMFCKFYRSNMQNDERWRIKETCVADCGQ